MASLAPALLALALSPAAFAQTTRLSPPLTVPAPPDDVVDYAVSPDGTWVVYVGERLTFAGGTTFVETAGLYSAGGPDGLDHELSGPIEIGKAIEVFAIDPTSTRVAFVANPPGAQGRTLFIAAIDGSSRTALSIGGGPVLPGIAFTPDGEQLVFRMRDGDANGDVGLWRVATSPLAAPVRIAPSAFELPEFDIHPSGDHVLWRSRAETDPSFGLSIARLDSSTAPVQLAASSVLLDTYEFSPDGTRVFFSTGVTLRSTLLDGSDPVDYPPLPTGIRQLEFSPLGNRVVTLAGGRLSRFDVDGPSPETLLYETGDPLQTGIFESIERFVLPGAGRVAYHANINDLVSGDDGDFVFSVSFAGGTSTQLFNGGKFSNISNLVAAANNTAVFDYCGLFSCGVFGANVATASSSGLSGFLLPSGFELSPDGFEITFPAFDPDTSGDPERIYVNDLGPGGPKAIGNTSSSGFLFADARFGPAGGRVYFRGDALVPGERHVFSSRKSAPWNLRQESSASTAPPSADAYGAVLSADGSTVVFEVDEGPGGNGSYYSAPADGSAPALPIAGPFSSLGTSPSDGEPIAPDGSRYVFLSQGTVFSVRTDGSEPPLALTDPAVIDGPTDPLWVDPSSSFVLFRDFVLGTGTIQYAVPIDGSGPPVSLGITNTFEPTLTDDGIAVFSSSFGVFAAAIDGSTPPVQLDAATPSLLGLAVQPSFATSSGDYAFYIVDGDVAGRPNLYVAPIDGSLPGVNVSMLSGFDTVGQAVPSVANDRIYYTVLGPSGTSVWSVVAGGTEAPVMIADDAFGFPPDESPDGRFIALQRAQTGPFSDPTVIAHADGTGPAFPVPGAGIDPNDAFSADGERYVYRDGDRVFSYRTDQAYRRQLLTPTAPGESVRSFAVSPGGSRVFYAADHGELDVVRLFVAPIDGPGSGLFLAEPGQPDGDVSGELIVTPDGSRVLYTMDATVDEDLELFVTAARPSLASLTPDQGRLGDLVRIEIVGRNFTSDVSVTFGGVPGIVTKVADSTRLEVLVPPLTAPPLGPAKVEVPVVVSNGTLDSIEVASFTYGVPAPSSLQAGGNLSIPLDVGH